MPVDSVACSGGQRRMKLGLRACCGRGERLSATSSRTIRSSPPTRPSEARSSVCAYRLCFALPRPAIVIVRWRVVMFSPPPWVWISSRRAPEASPWSSSASNTSAQLRWPLLRTLRLRSGCSARSTGGVSATASMRCRAACEVGSGVGSTRRYSVDLSMRVRAVQVSPLRRSGRCRPSWKISSADSGIGAKRSVHCSVVPAGTFASSAGCCRVGRPVYAGGWMSSR